MRIYVGHPKREKIERRYDMKIYVAGKITGLENFEQVFEEATNKLQEEGHTVMNPAILPPGFTQDEYMHVCYAMIDVCEAVYMLSNWRTSVGAGLEHEYAIAKGKTVLYQSAMCAEIVVEWKDKATK